MHRDLINAAVATARAAREEASTLRQSDGFVDNAEAQTRYAALMASSELALDEADRYKREAATEERLARIARELEPEMEPAPPSPMLRMHADDPTATREYAAAIVSLIRNKGIAALSEAERSVLTVASDGAGGYTVPADRRAQILRRLPALSVIGGLTFTFPTSRDTVEIPRVRRRATSGSIYTSAFVGSWIPEVPSATAGQNEPTFGMVKITINKARALARLSNDLKDDSEFDILGFLSEDGALNLALLKEYAIIAGTGVATEPLGLTNMPSAASPTEEQIGTIDIEGDVANTISNSITATGSAPKLITLHYALPAQYRRNARYSMNSTSMRKIRQLVDAHAQFLWVPGFAAEPDTLLGKPAEVSEFMPDDGVDGNKPILFGDFGQVYTPSRRDITVQIAPERYVDTDETGIFLSMRMGVGLSNRDAFRIGIV